jgi:hypothetical protein
LEKKKMSSKKREFTMADFMANPSKYQYGLNDLK